MKVISTVEVTVKNDREGLLIGYVEINITTEKKDDVNQIYHIKTADSLINNPDTDTETSQALLKRSGSHEINYYQISYEEYDQQREILSMMFPTELTGSKKDDYLLQMKLLYQLEIDPIYALVGNQWRTR